MVLVEILWASLTLGARMAPWLLVGFGAAALLKKLLPPGFVSRHMGGGFWGPLKASLLGGPVPVCSCGVLPLAAALRKEGASRGSVVSFLVTTPVTGPDSFAVTWSLLGLPFALWRVLTAVVSGLLGGWLLELRPERREGPAREERARPGWREALRFGFLTLPAEIGTWLFLGIFLGGAITALVPQGLLHLPGFWGYLGALAVSLPLYVCATGSVPIAAALMMKGLSPGAALAFLVAGPATNAASLGVIKKIAGGKGLWVYLLVIVAGSLGMGALLDWLGLASSAGAAAAHKAAPGLLEWLSLAALAGLYAYSKLSSLLRKPGHGAVVKVEGMSCQGCAERVRGAVASVKGVRGVWVDLKEGLVRVEGEASLAEVKRAIERAGYKVAP